MPTYEYKREDGTTFEVKQSINDDALEHCPETGQKVKRIISGGGGVVYKGEGWYVTDYKDSDRKEKRAEAAKKSNGEATSSKTSGENSGSNSTKSTNTADTTTDT
ncbi:putative regulatory protein, FmdB family [Fodinibius roseus]|uniref:Putative regulatory protein, FmdB family n=1 Tax=Fodinibius roseus TaxID=1194090 RepID=A0A1M5IFL0_9BACT|nr:FmdB family zinc ribbon protein [Fodinibius roseus]SHG27061.1 putative regulatory protein, FmdB family [Fodinibius roseus]